MPSKPVTRYECPHCFEHHVDAYDARHCCEPDTVTMYQCVKCGYIDADEDKANNCCYGDCPICGTTMAEHKLQPDIQACPECDWQKGDPLPPTPAELEKAGQLRLEL